MRMNGITFSVLTRCVDVFLLSMNRKLFWKKKVETLFNFEVVFATLTQLAVTTSLHHYHPNFQIRMNFSEESSPWYTNIALEYFVQNCVRKPNRISCLHKLRISLMKHPNSSWILEQKLLPSLYFSFFDALASLEVLCHSLIYGFPKSFLFWN